MTEQRVTRVGVLARLNAGEQLRTTQVGVLARLNAGEQLRTTQVGVLVRIDQMVLRTTTVGALVRISPLVIQTTTVDNAILAGPGDYSGEAAASAGIGGGNPKRLNPTAANVRQLTGIAGTPIPDGGGQGGAAAWSPGAALATAAGVMDRTGAFSVELYDPAGVRVITPDLTFTAVAFSAKAVGGPDQAAVTVAGAFPALWSALGWLAYSVRIVNPLGRVVWTGVVEEVGVTLPAYTIGLSLREMYNKVQVQYTRTMDAENDAESLATDWAQDATSIARYSTKEIKASLNDGSLAQAEALRGTILATVSEPQQTVNVAESGESGAQLLLVGRWLLLDWEYYSNDTGYVTYEADNAYKELIGFALTSDRIGFREDGIHDLAMRLNLLEPGASMVISGSVSNNRTVTLDSAPNTTIDDQVTVTSDTIGFDPTNDIHSASVDWSPFIVGEMIEVIGSTSNDGGYWIKKIDALSPGPGDPRLEVYGGGIVGEASGDTVTVTQGHHAVAADVTFIEEAPGATVTLASYTKIAQKFVASGSWDAQDILMLAARTGAPADALQFSLYSDTAGAPGTLLASGTVTGAFVGESLNLIECSLATPVAVVSGTSYWIVAERTGAADDEAFWHIGVSDEKPSTFTAKIWTGTAWIDHPSNVDCPLKVWATVDSATKAGMVADASSWVERVDVRSLTDVRVRLFSDGSKRISEEIQSLIDAGNDDAARLLAWFDGAVFVVDVQQADDGALALAADGRFVMLPQQELEAGLLPVRRWVRILDLPPGAIFEKMSPFYIETATYAVEKLALAVESRGNLSVWDLGL